MGLGWQGWPAHEDGCVAVAVSEMAVAPAIAEGAPEVTSVSARKQRQRQRQRRSTDGNPRPPSAVAETPEASPVKSLPCFDLEFAGLEAFSLRTAEDEEADFGPRLQSMLERRCLDWADLPKESDTGCIEYKWRLGLEHDSPQRSQRLATQMKFRLGEGGGTAFYLLGVHDSGSAAGLSPDEHAAAVRVLMGAAAVTDAFLLLEAMSERRRGGKRCSAWRVQHRDAALRQMTDLLHLSSCVREAKMLVGDSDPRGIDMASTRLAAALCC
mmetsp:Transcript_145603/g.363152  ORF Transcript_145603/g.363152 Transcript_145603/m.363152 type:complete len:269 (-) Transcript_145603:391-1197(-)